MNRNCCCFCYEIRMDIFYSALLNICVFFFVLKNMIVLVYCMNKNSEKTIKCIEKMMDNENEFMIVCVYYFSCFFGVPVVQMNEKNEKKLG